MYVFTYSSPFSDFTIGYLNVFNWKILYLLYGIIDVVIYTFCYSISFLVFHLFFFIWFYFSDYYIDKRIFYEFPYAYVNLRACSYEYTERCICGRVCLRACLCKYIDECVCKSKKHTHKYTLKHGHMTWLHAFLFSRVFVLFNRLRTRFLRYLYVGNILIIIIKISR